MGAVMVLIPRMAALLMEGLLPISDAASAFIQNDLCQDFGHEKSGIYAARNTFLGSDNSLSKRSKNSSITSRHPVADCRVGAPAVVVGLYKADHSEPRLLARGKRAAVVISLLRVAKKDSATALSWRLPVRPHESLT